MYRGTIPLRIEWTRRGEFGFHWRMRKPVVLSAGNIGMEIEMKFYETTGKFVIKACRMIGHERGEGRCTDRARLRA